MNYRKRCLQALVVAVLGAVSLATLPDTAAARSPNCQYCVSSCPESPQLKILICDRLSGGWCFGTKTCFEDECIGIDEQTYITIDCGGPGA